MAAWPLSRLAPRLGSHHSGAAIVGAAWQWQTYIGENYAGDDGETAHTLLLSMIVPTTLLLFALVAKLTGLRFQRSSALMSLAFVPLPLLVALLPIPACGFGGSHD